MFGARWTRGLLFGGAVLGAVGIGTTVITVVACGSSSAAAVVYEVHAPIKAEWNLNGDYVPFYFGYNRGKVVRTTLTSDTKVGDAGAQTTYRYDPEGTSLGKPFEVTYEWTVLASLDDWTMPVVDHLTDVRQRFFSYFDDDTATPQDPGTGQSRVASIHDGDTFSLASTRNTDLQGPIGLIKQRLVANGAMTSADPYVLEASTRLIGADTPELTGVINGTFPPTTGTERLWADRATDFVKQQLGSGSTMATAPLLTVSGKETYGRTIADVKYVPTGLASTMNADAADKQAAWNDLAVDLVRFGLARVAYTQHNFMEPTVVMPGVNAANRDYIAYLIELQAKAVADRVGLWSTARQRWWAQGALPGQWNPGDAVFPKGGSLTTENGLA